MQQPQPRQDIAPKRVITPPPLPHHPAAQPSKKRFSKKKLLLGVGIAAALIALAAILWLLSTKDQQSVMSDRFQVVYMSTGQIYFGKLQNTKGNYLTLDNAFTVQNQSDTTENTEQKIEQSQTSLIRVSSQTYGPENSMALNTKQVLFWQNLRDDSKVAQVLKSAQ